MFRPAFICATAVLRPPYARAGSPPGAPTYQRATGPPMTGGPLGRSLATPRAPSLRSGAPPSSAPSRQKRPPAGSLAGQAGRFRSTQPISRHAGVGPSTASPSMGTHVRYLHIPSCRRVSPRGRVVTRLRVSRRRACPRPAAETRRSRARRPSAPRSAFTAARATWSPHERRVPQGKRRVSAAMVRHRSRRPVLRPTLAPHHRSRRTDCRSPPAPRRSAPPRAVTDTRRPHPASHPTSHNRPAAPTTTRHGRATARPRAQRRTGRP
ncbi:MAG: hypothetical protein QOK16_1369 [Solirubrobacteraceae bacterium]|nr:hypothetical protein [Solirubrobacteraceae bacterium]